MYESKVSLKMLIFIKSFFFLVHVTVVVFGCDSLKIKELLIHTLLINTLLPVIKLSIYLCIG